MNLLKFVNCKVLTLTQKNAFGTVFSCAPNYSYSSKS